MVIVGVVFLNVLGATVSGGCVFASGSGDTASWGAATSYGTSWCVVSCFFSV